MPKKEISILIKARNAVGAGLKAVGVSLKKFAGTVKNVGKFFAKAFIGAGVAIVALSTKLLQAFSVQEKAVKQTEAAFRAYGEEVTENTKAVQKFAAAIQNETGIADEQTIALAAQLKLIGVATPKLEAATKATIALQKAGMRGAAAARAVAAATQGDFEALQRYLPALKTATSEAEKARIVNDFVTKSYAAQKDELNTVSGQWTAFKGRIGDVLEQLGSVIANDGALTGMLKRAGDAVLAFGGKISRFIAAGGIGDLVAGIKLFAENARNSFMKIGIIAEGVFKGSLWNPGKAVFQFLGSVIGTWVNKSVEELKFLGKLAVAVFEKIKNPLKKFEPPDTTALFASYREVGKALTGQLVDKVPNAFEEMYAKLDAEQKRHNAKTEAISKEQLDRAQKNADDRVDLEQKAQEQIVIAAENADKKIEELQKKKKKLEDQLRERQREEQKKAAKEELDDLEKRLAKQQEITKKTVQGILAEQRAQQAADDQAAADLRRAERLRRRKGRLNKKDMEFLRAFDDIQAARQGAGILGLDVAQAKEKIKALDNRPNIDAIKTELKKHNEKLDELLVRE
jgi:hypothetical protein